MRQRSIAGPAVLFGIGVVALVAGVVLSLVPFPTAGSASPTAAFTAQKNLDEVAFGLGGSPGARYTGTLTTTSDAPDSDPQTVEFTDLTVAATKNADGEIAYNSTAAEYRQIGNYRYLKGPSRVWTDLFDGAPVASALDLGAVDDTWTDLRYSGLPDLGYLLSPALLAGRIGNTERVEPPQLGLELPAPNQGTPDARFWPTSDPVITAVDADTLRVGSMETTFDPSTKQVTHITGEFEREGIHVSIDTDVTVLAPDDLATLYADERALVPDLLSIPAPAVPLADNPINTRATGSCTPASCGFTITASGALNPEVVDEMRPVNGHINFGITVRYAVDDGRPGERGGTCTRVLTTPFGGRADTRCAATDLPQGARGVRAIPTLQYLPFIDSTEGDLNEYIDSQEESSKQPITLVRTGIKQPEAARYNDQVVGFPSSYGVKVGDYVFDGVGPQGNLFVSFAPGYAEHITGGRLDPDWAGTDLLTQQLDAQLTAAGDREITYVTAEPELASALRLLALTEGVDLDDISVFPTPIE
ncbi:hypothetical protein VZC37_02580 [Gordonia sp. LSe1-13]|uniref:Uncharacterized protein n=1 Tax=Gordonia sesuvii TaxID=3116777 RepID=A0ABU7M9G6_9ACTN|nr:hypothetical protein [Gordonia sp. LSe1-13]